MGRKKWKRKGLDGLDDCEVPGCDVDCLPDCDLLPSCDLDCLPSLGCAGLGGLDRDGRKRRRRKGRRHYGSWLVGQATLLAWMVAATVGGYFRVAPVRDAPRGQRAALRLLRSYQAHVSPRRGPVCHLAPSCSRFAIIAVRRHGLLRALPLVRARLRACAAAGAAARADRTARGAG